MTDATEVPPRPSWWRSAAATDAGREKTTGAVPPQAQPPAEPAPATPPDRPASWATLWLTDRDVGVFTALAAIVLVLLVVRWLQISGWGMHEVAIERLQPLELTYRLDLNTATWVELSQLDGVGETLALRIVEHRETHGPFHSVDDLDAVKGIGPKTLDRLRPFLRVKGEPAAQ